MSDYLAANPLHGNPLATKADLQRAMRDLFTPLVPHVSPGRARVKLGATAAHFDPAAAELEGFARPLWGLAPLAAGGGAFDHSPLIRAGLSTGSDPRHDEFWGEVRDRDQRMVETAALGFALALAPRETWDGLAPAAQKNLVAWLKGAMTCEPYRNNWNFFPVMVALGLEQVGQRVNWTKLEPRLALLENLDIGGGWYRDGPTRQVEHYIAFAMHFYGLIYARLRRGDDARRIRLIERARAFAPDYRDWFAADGAALPFGRSLTYRFAHGAFWAALAFADVEALPWGEIKGLLLSNLRWWRDQPIADRDGVLSVGYATPNLLMSEEYNSPGSPYWAAKAFTVLALPDDHPFWTEPDVPPAGPAGIRSQPQPGMVIYACGGDVVALSSGQQNLAMRRGSEKYAKFAYATRYGFSVESADEPLGKAALDSMLGLSDDGRYYRIREACADARIGDGLLYSRWTPWPDVDIETWLIAAPPWHFRVHRVRTGRTLSTAEGGFAIDRNRIESQSEEARAARVVTSDDITTIVDLSPTARRHGAVVRAMPNTNLLFPRSAVPQLHGGLSPGDHVLACAVVAARRDVTSGPPPALPTPGELDTMRDRAAPVAAWSLPETGT